LLLGQCEPDAAPADLNAVIDHLASFELFIFDANDIATVDGNVSWRELTLQVNQDGGGD
jgi:hypothetical protein